MNDLPDIGRSDSILEPDTLHRPEPIRVIRAYFQNIFICELFTQLLTLWNWSKSIKSIRFFNGVINGPSSGNPVSENEIAHPYFCGQIHHTHRLSFVCEAAITAAIICLLFSSSPPAVRFTVVAIIVLAIQGMGARWFVSHVDHEAHESTQSTLSFFPSFADLYSATSVVGIFCNIRIPAPTEHHGPLTVCGVIVEFWLVVGRKLQNVFSGLIHIQGMVGSSAGRPASTGHRRALFMPLA